MRKRRMLPAILVAVMLVSGSITAMADAPADGKTSAQEAAEAAGQNDAWEAWVNEWETKKNDWTIVSLTPGADQTQMNFAWYSTEPEAKLVISSTEDMSGVLQEISVTGEEKEELEKEGNAYYVCHAVVEGLEPGSYYYQVDDRDTAPFRVDDTQDGFTFLFVGDPQIGSSNELKGDVKEEFFAAQSDSVMSDSYNWSNTLNQALATNPNASFVLSAGDQVQTTVAKAPENDVTVSEIEYTGYLSPEALKSLPVATTVGNHDADNANYTYHFNIPNLSELGSNQIVGGDYWFTYGDALFLMLNTQDTNAAEHKQFIEEAVAANPDAVWRIATLHQDIYGSAEHSNEPEITNLRYTLVPYFEEYEIDVVLTGHDHAYSRSQLLKGGEKTTEYTDDEFDEMLDADIDAGEDEGTVYTAYGNIADDTTDEKEAAYISYLNEVMDENAVEQVEIQDENGVETVTDPEGILYMTANSSSGSKYYDLTSRMQTYVASRWQEDVPTYSVVEITKNSFTIDTYRTDTNEKIDTTFRIVKTAE